MSVRIECTGSAVSTVHITAEEAALRRIAAALIEPVELPDGCPGLEARILAAIEELARERTEARTMAHEMAMEVDRLTRELAADAECEGSTRGSFLDGVDRTRAALAAAGVEIDIGRALASLRDLRDDDDGAECEERGRVLDPATRLDHITTRWAGALEAMADGAEPDREPSR